MLSSSRTMFSTLFACSILTGCSSDLIAPGTRDGANASVVSAVRAAASGPVTLSLSDSTLMIGDTVRAVAVARNLRTNRDVSRELKFYFTSADTSVATIDRRGLVTAKAKGISRIRVRTLLGSASVDIGVGVLPISRPDTVIASRLPGVIDTQPDPVVAVPTVPVAAIPAPEIGRARVGKEC